MSEIATPPPPVVDEDPVPAILHGPYNFINGPAGTGKTYLARQMVRDLPGTLLCATTGIAAVNLGEGTTINAALGYFDTASLIDSYQRGALTARLGKLWRAGTRRILLDEVSMLDAEQLSVITRALEELRGRGYVMNQSLADEVGEGASGESLNQKGIALTIIGDFLQLPPVKATFAFESPEWKRFGDQTHKLVKVRRQVDPGFIAAMAAARSGDKDTVCDYFASRVVAQIDPHFAGMTVVATNDAADRLNHLRLDAIKSPLVYWGSERWGKDRGDWKNIPDQLGLKVGALVMVLANARDPLTNRMIYANGDLGEVVEMDQAAAAVRVRLQRTGGEHCIDWVTRDNRIPLEPGRRAALKAANQLHLIDDTGKWETIGGITYLPLRLAYASTVHKVQGLSLDTVQVATREGMFRNPGLLYVALTRARTPEGLRLVGTIDGLRERVTVHPEVSQWI